MIQFFHFYILDLTITLPTGTKHETITKYNYIAIEFVSMIWIILSILFR